MKRIFLAINFSEEIKNKLVEFQKELSQYLPNIRWIKLENIHLTLVFLGRIDLGQLEKVCRIAKTVIGEIEPFSLSLKGLGVFPEVRRAKILWVGVYGDSMLKLLNQGLFRKLSQASFVLDDRAFTPHVTIGRANDEKPNKEAIMFCLNKFKDADFGSVEIKSIEVMESQLRRSGPIYSVLEKIKLRDEK